MKISRFICRIPSGGILFVVFTLLVTLCAVPAYPASEPGTVTIVLAAEPINLDPGEAIASGEGVVLMKNIIETLTERNHLDSSIMPRLAHAWKQIDANTWHFFLRKGIRFHDGADFNAEAVIANIKRLYDPRAVNNARLKYFSNVIMEGKALDSHTLEIKTDRFEPLLLTLMTTLGIGSPNTPLGKLVRVPIGTGPYKFVKWDAGTQIVVERYDGYWGKQPEVKKAVYVWRGESALRASMVEIGEADLTPSIAKQHANRPDLDQSYLNSETTSLKIGGVWEPPLNDRRVRMALNYAVDRDAIRGSILSKDVVPATQMIAPSIFGHNPDLKVWPYDPKKARQVLSEARKDGVPVDKEILLVGRSAWYPGGEELMEAVMTMYKAVGLNVKIKMGDGQLLNIYRRHPFPTNVGPYLAQESHDNNAGDAAFTAFGKFHCKGINSPLCDKTVDDLIEKAQVATGEERRKLWRAAFQAIDESIPQVMLFHMVAYARVGKRINFKPSIATINEIPLAQITFKQ